MIIYKSYYMTSFGQGDIVTVGYYSTEQKALKMLLKEIKRLEDIGECIVCQWVKPIEVLD